MTIRKKQTVLINAFMSIFVFAFLLSFMPFHLQAETAADNVALNNAMPNGGVNPVYSPDGKRIAFTSGTMHAQSDIWIIDPDGGNPKRLTFSGANEMSWSSDGRYIYYQKNYTGYRTYLRINIEGEPVEENFVTMPEHSTGMTLSPDGKKIAYLKRTGEFTDLYIMDRDGNNERGLTE
ncbi:MAG: PD40 domain-containing protein, partial [Nitrospirae bacterium]|nr:PD40 domain-containing protein [Nitrospirota bacterium]